MVFLAGVCLEKIFRFHVILSSLVMGRQLVLESSSNQTVDL